MLLGSAGNESEHSPILNIMYTVARVEDLTWGGTHFAANDEVAGMAQAENKPATARMEEVPVW